MRKLVRTDEVKLAYRRYATVYDRLFGAVFEPGRRSAVEKINRLEKQRILEVGVGTGLSLSHYRKDARVTGIDLSKEMLDKARQRVETCGLAHVESLLEMDAEAMSFADASFDVVVGMYVASVVPNPEKLLSEMRRVCVPHGDIVLVNHFTSRNPLLRGLEKGLSPFAGKIGFQADFQMAPLLELAGIEVTEIAPVNMLGYWTLIRMRNVPRAGNAPGTVAQLEYSGEYDMPGRSSAAE
ncbi:MAG: class I SAM-dependent methyltransferase [Alphaproteobacteria bacterium]